MAMSLVKKSLATALLVATAALAQTTTDCNPTNTTCDPDTGLSSSTYSVDFTQGADNDSWTVEAGSVSYTSSGAEFIIKEQGDAPTIQTAFYFFFGRAEVHLKTAAGTGIVSSVVLESDDLDEIDWEWLGGVADQVQTDYFGKGNTTAYDRGGYTNLTDSAQTTSHNYTIDWSAEAIVWYVDGAVVRTLAYADAVDGTNFPQTPMRLKLGIWAGGDPDNAEGTIEWAGGETDYDDAPFTMTVESVSIYNANPASSYTYSDKTGDYTSITIDASNDTTSSSSSSSSSSSTTSSSSAGSTSVSSGSTSNSASSSNSTSTGSSNATSTGASSASTSSSAVNISAGSSTLPTMSFLPGLAVFMASLYFL